MCKIDREIQLIELIAPKGFGRNLTAEVEGRLSSNVSFIMLFEVFTKGLNVNTIYKEK